MPGLTTRKTPRASSSSMPFGCASPRNEAADRSPGPGHRDLLALAREYVEAPRFRLAVVLGVDGVTAFRKPQQEDRALGCNVQHRTSTAVRDANVDVGHELVRVLRAVVPRERQSYGKFGAQRPHPVRFFGAEAAVDVFDARVGGH